jgi:hypothetical protein
MLPEHLRNATPAEVFAWRQKYARKARFTTDECQQFFRQRMRRDGKEGELDSLIEKYRVEGKGRRLAIYAAMRDLGYVNPKEEQKLYKRWVARAMQDRRREVQTNCAKRYRKKMRDKELEEVMDTLPKNAPPEKEMDWVVGHRQLFRAAMQLDEDDPEPIRLTGPDAKDAPSQAAVTMLKIALKDPAGWMEKKRDANKSKTAVGGGGDDDKSDAIDDLDEVERMLKAALRDE